MTNVKDNIDYDTFLNIINTIPSCIFFKDVNLRYQFSSHYWEQLTGEDVSGKTDWDIRKDKENIPAAEKADKEIIATGKGCKYTIISNIEGVTKYLELIKEPVFDKNHNVIGIVGLINDITEKTLLDLKFKELSSRDMLTDVLNRQTGTEIIIKSLSTSTDGRALYLLDLNHFKKINDTYGHQVGDKVLMAFANVLRTTVRSSDVVMRLGGDEFILFIDGIKTQKEALIFAQRICNNLKMLYIPEIESNISTSIGICMAEPGDTFDTLYSKADEKMYLAKKHSTSYYEI